MRRGVGYWLEAAFCVFALSIFLGAYVTVPLRLQGLSIAGGETSPWNAAAMASVLAGTLVLIAIRWREVLFALRHGGAVNLFVALALVSVLWSEVPVPSFRRWVSLMQAFLFAYYLLAAHPVERVIRFLATAILISLVASAAFAIGVPHAGVMQEPSIAGSWTGVYGHKNQLGAIAVIGVLCFGWLWRNDPAGKTRHALGVLFCIFMAVMARSLTAQLAVVLIVSFSLYLPMLRLPGAARLWAIYGVVATAAIFGTLLLVFFADLMHALGRDASLTGRVPTWQRLLELAMTRPLTGHGYNAFWVVGNTEVQDVWRFAGWEMWNAHSAFLDIALQLGIPGLVLVVWILAEVIIRALREWLAGDLPWASFALVFALGHTVTASVESTLFRGGDIVALLFVLLSGALRLRAAARAAEALSASVRPGRSLHPAYAHYL